MSGCSGRRAVVASSVEAGTPHIGMSAASRSGVLVSWMPRVRETIAASGPEHFVELADPVKHEMAWCRCTAAGVRLKDIIPPVWDEGGASTIGST